jgi:hypothetical protein
MRPFLLPFLLALVLSVGTGCRDGGEPEMESTSPSEFVSSPEGSAAPGLKDQPSETEDPAELLRTAIARAGEENTFRFRFEAQTFTANDPSGSQGSGGKTFMEAEGAADLAAVHSYVAARVMFLEIENIQLRDECFERSSLQGELWVEGDCGEVFFDRSEDTGLVAITPIEFLQEMLEAGPPILDLGDTVVRDSPARRLRLEADAEDLADYGMEGVITLDAWIGEGGLPIQVAYVGTVVDEDGQFGPRGELVGARARVAFFDWGEPVDIQRPPVD